MQQWGREEQELLDSVERGEWRSAPHANTELKRYIRLARSTLKKEKRVNIRLSRLDVEGLQVKAIQEGLPYQTLIASILHKYVAGHLQAV